MSENPFGQDGYRVRFDWGLRGAEAVSNGATTVAVVDVLSFTTTLTVAADRWVTVLPYQWRDSSAQKFAAQQDAALAVPRSQAGRGDVSLSPASVQCAHDLQRLVLPSPNGSTIAHALAGMTGNIIGVSLRNVAATAAWTAAKLSIDPSSWVAVVAAGERWPDTSMRPAVEDLWGAGAYIAALTELGVPDISPEAEAAAAAFRQSAPNLFNALHGSASGRELTAMGYHHDVDVAAEIDMSQAIPLLIGNAFVNAAN